VLCWANRRLSVSELDDRLETLHRDTPEPVWHAQMNLLTSHDTPRLLNLVEFDVSRMLLAVALQMAYPGMPMVYYGEEAGCTQVNPLAESGRVSFPWDAIDPDVHRFFRTAITARRASLALSRGTAETVWIDDASGTYGFAREHDDERVLALFNAGAHDATIDLAERGTWQDLLQRMPDATAASGRLRITLPPDAAAWFRRM
jgi:glycosidase